MEQLETINQRLKDFYGLFENGEPNWRIVWSDDQREKRFGTYEDTTENGIFLCEVTEWRELPKYPFVKHKYILERLIPVPEGNADELTTKLSYESMWVFQDHFGNSLPPHFDVCQLIIATIYENMTRSKGVKRYKTPELEMQTKEAIAARLEVTEKALFGNETSLGDALAYDSAVGYGIRNRHDN